MEESFIIWHDKYDTGIESIDREHRNLVDIINRFHADMNSRRIDKEESFRSAAHNLMNYVKEHFSNEEKWMLEAKYPDYDLQHAAHQHFIKVFVEDVMAFSSYNPHSAYHFLEFLKDWFLSHVAISDNQFRFHKEKLDAAAKKQAAESHES